MVSGRGVGDGGVLKPRKTKRFKFDKTVTALQVSAAFNSDKIYQMKFASRLDHVETSAIRELFKLLGKPGIISFAGGFPDSAMFDVEGLQEATDKVFQQEPGGA